MDEHIYIVAYDISDQRRWRQVFKAMNGFGEWLQLSIFQCRLHRKRLAQLEAELGDLISHEEDHLMIMDLGPADQVEPRVRSLGKPFQAVEKEATIV
jgi:CRISPR-associated protein Cas2